METTTHAERALSVDRAEPLPHVTFTPGANCPRCLDSRWMAVTFRDGSRSGSCVCRARGVVRS